MDNYKYAVFYCLTNKPNTKLRGWIFVTEYFKTLFLKIQLSVNYADFCLEGHVLTFDSV